MLQELPRLLSCAIRMTLHSWDSSPCWLWQEKWELRQEFLNQSRNFGGAKTAFSHCSGIGSDFDSLPQCRGARMVKSALFPCSLLCCIFSAAPDTVLFHSRGLLLQTSWWAGNTGMPVLPGTPHTVTQQHSLILKCLQPPAAYKWTAKPIKTVSLKSFSQRSTAMRKIIGYVNS